jgi:hypothetical protein
MPRHPPCALTHLTTNKMLASTMQHSTHHHTPTHRRHHHTPPHQRAALDDQTRSGHQEHTTGTNPHRCLLRTQQRAEPAPFRTSTIAFHPATPTPTTSNDATDADPGMESSERRTPTTRPPAQHRRTQARGQPHHPAGLLRKEVIQPHLPVRLPCYDFVPIASPTFDDSPRRTG